MRKDEGFFFAIPKRLFPKKSSKIICFSKEWNPAAFTGERPVPPHGALLLEGPHAWLNHLLICHLLEILIIFEKKSPYAHFALELENYELMQKGRDDCVPSSCLAFI